MKESARRKKARDHLRRAGYKSGGHVKEDVEKGVHEHEAALHKGEKKTKINLKHGGCADGGKPKHRADKLARGGKAKGKGGHGKVTVNVINAHGGHPPPRPVPVPVPPPGAGAMPPGGPMAGPPPGAGPMPPPPDQGPGPGLKRGGRAHRAKGGQTSTGRDKIGGLPDGHFRKGGRTKHRKFTAGAGSAEGRLQKIGAPLKR